jgi:hypothetical protein
MAPRDDCGNFHVEPWISQRNRKTRDDLPTHGFHASLLRGLDAALRRQRGRNDRVLHVDGGDKPGPDAGRLDDVDGQDTDVRPDRTRK